MPREKRESSGWLIAAFLSGAWRSAPAAPEVSAADLARLTPLLLGSGAGALGWRLVRHSDLRDSLHALKLEQAYKLHSLQAALHEREIEVAFGTLRAAGVEPLLVKGWAIARLYPEKGLRPYGDLDLCVAPDQYSAAQKALTRPEAREFETDLHRGADKLDDERWGRLWERSQLIQLGKTAVRVPCPEDHLRLLCLHLLRHGGFRPLWFCDLALALESRPADFDWDLCLGRRRRRADGVACALGVAHQLLGARLSETPVEARARRLPKWLVPAVLKQWAHPFTPERYRAPMKTYLRHPRGLLAGLRHRWPDPIEATASVGGPFNELPRLPFQLASCLVRAIGFLAQVPGALREPR